MSLHVFTTPILESCLRKWLRSLNRSRKPTIFCPIKKLKNSMMQRENYTLKINKQLTNIMKIHTRWINVSNFILTLFTILTSKNLISSGKVNAKTTIITKKVANQILDIIQQLAHSNNNPKLALIVLLCHL